MGMGFTMRLAYGDELQNKNGIGDERVGAEGSDSIGSAVA